MALANGDTAQFKIGAEKNHSAPASVHHSLLSDAYNYVTAHPTELKIAAGTAVVAASTLALRHYMPASVAEKITTTGASFVERALGATPKAVQEFKVLETQEAASTLVSKLKTDSAASGFLRVKDASGVESNLLVGHSPLSAEAAAKADRIATCSLPEGCAEKGLFGQQKGRVFFNFDGENRTLKFSESGDSLASRVSRFFQREEHAWAPLGPHASNNLKALASDRAIMPKLEAIHPVETKAPPTVKEVLDQWESQQRIINRNADRQDFLSNLIRHEVLPELKNSGQVPKEWRFFSTQVHSAADHAEMDGIFVHEGTGDFHLVDFSSSPFKRIRPWGESLDVRRAGITERTDTAAAELASARNDGMRDKKIAGIRTQGLMGYDAKWFDLSGKLDVEKFDAAEFRRQVATQLSDLTEAPAYFNVRRTPLADIVSSAPDTQVKQLEALKKWSLGEAAKPDSMHPEGYKEYAESLEKSIGFINKTHIAVGDTKHFSTLVQDSAEQAIFRWAADRTGTTIAAEEQMAARALTAPLNAAQKGNSDIGFVKEKGVLSFTHEGLHYSSDELTGSNGVLERARLALFQKGRVKEMFDHLRDKQKMQILMRLGTNNHPATEEKAINAITQTLVNRGTEIKAGGQRGFPRNGELPILIQQVQTRMQVRDVETMLRPTAIPGAAEVLNPQKLPRMH